ncbi:hypothetical protein V6N13_068661 [Hibiscus sabdariffa]|uniref:Uncharacterized protein n=1 Tax=Hibiscus sabdariffa TaxID=183260 RepID=A0ABR2QN82_9ROSI
MASGCVSSEIRFGEREGKDEAADNLSSSKGCWGGSDDGSSSGGSCLQEGKFSPLCDVFISEEKSQMALGILIPLHL